MLKLNLTNDEGIGIAVDFGDNFGTGIDPAYILYKSVSGSDTQLDVEAVTPTAGDIISVTTTSSTTTVKLNGVQIMSGSTSDVPANTGLRFYLGIDTSIRIDDFSIENCS